jgi:plasmid replication initiation protein
METNKEIALYNTENLVVHSNDFIKAYYKDKVTFWEMILFGKLCSMIGPYDKEFRDYEIHIKDITEFLDLPRGGKIYEYVLDAAQRLLDRKVIVYFKDEKGEQKELETYLVTSVERYNKRMAHDKLVINLTFHPKLKPFLLELSRDFTKLDITNYKFLHTGSSIRIYQILKQYVGKRQHTVEIELEELKRMLGVADKYESYNRFKVKVLDEAQKRLENTTDLKFTYDEIKNSRKIVAIKFHIHDSRSAKQIEEEQKVVEVLPPPSVSAPILAISDSDISAEQLFTELYPLVVVKWQVSPKVFMALTEQHSEKEIRQAVRVTERALQGDKIKNNSAGFFVKAVQEKYTDTVETQVQKTKAVQTKIETTTRQDKEQVQKRSQAQKEKFQQEETLILKLIGEDSTLQEVAIAKVQSSMFGSSYDVQKSLPENLKNMSFKAAFFNAVRTLKSELFTQ